MPPHRHHCHPSHVYLPRPDPLKEQLRSIAALGEAAVVITADVWNGDCFNTLAIRTTCGWLFVPLRRRRSLTRKLSWILRQMPALRHVRK